jgi:hypothetical protein
MCLLKLHGDRDEGKAIRNKCLKRLLRGSLVRKVEEHSCNQYLSNAFLCVVLRERSLMSLWMRLWHSGWVASFQDSGYNLSCA